ncbi:MAG: hydrogenase formation protein HypD, partial [Proteobacteria bacterium]|nr:hydrogenase formation protein HypD [Pseudomonadota bacterium]
CDSNWRGLGLIPESGLTLRDEYRSFAAEDYFDLKVQPAKDHPDCVCGEVICGTKNPAECRFYRKVCTPQNPIGPCMVSTEGTCAAYYKYYIA